MDFPELNYIYKDDYTLLIDKPIGMATQSKESEEASLEDIVKQSYEYIHFVNRLDQPVGGLVLVCTTKEATRYYDKCIRNKQIHKTYHAIIEGKLDVKQQTLNHTIKKKGNKSILDPNGKQARMSFKSLYELERFTAIELVLDTGRFHQIRCQLSAINHPIKGDLKYGSKRSNPEGGIYLHCRTITFSPFKTWDEPSTFISPYPQMSLWKVVEDSIA